MHPAPPAAKTRQADLQPWHGYAFALATYVIVTAFTNAYFSADAIDYVDSILTHQDFWDFGHLLWRPLGWLAYQICRPLLAHPGADARANVMLVLMGLNWAAGAACVLLLYSLLTRVSAKTQTNCVVILFFIFSQAFLNYAQTGNAYAPGLALLLLGFYCAVRSGERDNAALGWSAGSGLAVAGAVGMWLPYVLALPACLVTPYFLTSGDPAPRRTVLCGAVSFAVALSGVYLLVIMSLGLHSPAAVRAWIAAASHGIPPSRGVLRMAFGLARSFINLGNDGVLFKRFLMHDPYNSVSLANLVRASLWKLLLFYAFAATLVISLMRATEGHKILALFALNALPVICFAIFWQGGDMERYFALYPTFFLALAALLNLPSKSPAQLARWSQALALAFIVVTVATNLGVMAKPVLQRQEQAAAARLLPLQPLLKPASIVVVTHLQDELINFNRTYPSNPLNRDKHIHLRALVTLSTDEVPRWKQVFAARAVTAWNHGGDVWLSRRVLSSRPQAAWNWAEGDDKRVSWHDLFRFFEPFEKGQTVGGADGFVLLKNSPHNRHLLPMPAVLDSKMAEAP